MVRPLASHECGLGSIPGVNVRCGLSWFSIYVFFYLFTYLFIYLFIYLLIIYSPFHGSSSILSTFSSLVDSLYMYYFLLLIILTNYSFMFSF